MYGALLDHLTMILLVGSINATLNMVTCMWWCRSLCYYYWLSASNIIHTTSSAAFISLRNFAMPTKDLDLDMSVYCESMPYVSNKLKLDVVIGCQFPLIASLPALNWFRNRACHWHSQACTLCNYPCSKKQSAEGGSSIAGLYRNSNLFIAGNCQSIPPCALFYYFSLLCLHYLFICMTHVE